MNGYRLAVDIGASSGRVMAGRTDGDELDLIEVHRFRNSATLKAGHYCWDVDYLFNEIKYGIKTSCEMGFKPVSIGINTWAVDFVLLDEQDNRLTEAVSYRDARTDGIMEEVINTYGKAALYERTGIAFQPFNTLYQLLALKKLHPKTLAKAKSFLMVPDYLHFLLTGIKTNEYTNATTTQLVNAFSKRWDEDLIAGMGLPVKLFHDLKLPGTNIGPIKAELQRELGVKLDVIIPATHDTASAIVAVPEWQTSLYISSGTWSLIGIENPFPICITKAMDDNFTNEGGINYRFRFLKNIMGLWMIQEVQRLLPEKWTYADLAVASKKTNDISTVDVDQRRFLKPDHMIEEIQAACRETGQEVPTTAGELAKCIYVSLVASYEKAIKQIEQTVERRYEKIHIIGGGSQNGQLNQMLANRTNKTVIAGPSEATAIGNFLMQCISCGEIPSLEAGRALVKNSFKVMEYKPQRSDHAYANKI
ncbi:rhamnulokinase [Shouchella patagoniensis]|uniref:rhamnulokinase n=1 Tax=Shouchella patagoniensis TaxID=228576 RepID=UPI000995678C|nr:rhamnulokinase [Shouchella patagoniensis]